MSVVEGRTDLAWTLVRLPKMTRRRRLESPLLRWLIGKETVPAYHELLWV
jgi:hypothetical protein